jgi:hypothetical protein
VSDPALLRRVGAEVERRLAALGLASRAHLGPDVADEWRRRILTVPPDASLNWVAFDFPGLSVWDVHLGVLAELDAQPARATVGLHVFQPHWRTTLALLARGDESMARALEIEARVATEIQEVQLNDPWRELDLGRPDEEVEWLATRAVELYRLVRPRIAELAVAIEAEGQEQGERG